ncbi:LpxI family protein [Limnochorda pilosa]|uniref:UDP-2,3-diacylglucosamine pyrophosphatase n=1 Tax=Limnochorda pilosa TaxID=1555112 RepID=A0A0K2SP61_LIMPI|nr:UDP-2,3-diacylglucosamine diphosphatase LpxI [Limnochorda pilosa]BAS28891.1 hypothetical protein LIP_3062 [Limnochorda pilosa]
MTSDPSDVAILAGAGRLPVEAATRLRRSGKPALVVAVAPEPDPELARQAGACHRVDVGQWDEVKRRLREGGARKVVLLGKVPKTSLYHAPLDAGIRRLLDGLRARNDDAILGALVNDLAALGLEVLPQAWAVPHLVMPEGQLTRSGASPEEQQDVALGFTVARAIAGLDLGQTVVLRGRAVTAVEAIEGTDACILRGGALAGDGAVVVKVRKPAQDPRFDLPTMGLDTLAVAQRAGVRVLALEAGEALLVDREAVIQAADEAGICLLGIREEQARAWGSGSA